MRSQTICTLHLIYATRLSSLCCPAASPTPAAKPTNDGTARAPQKHLPDHPGGQLERRFHLQPPPAVRHHSAIHLRLLNSDNNPFSTHCAKPLLLPSASIAACLLRPSNTRRSRLALGKHQL